ncbi:hypothetical protein BKA69DRAFT_1047041 [Paraphysoderma sedebokerense]|nr:hypothetical protein BKA69DRAFT_1047041 [Paraphysoderma sedebokerense]
MDHKVKFELNQIASDLKVDQKVVLDYVVGYISKKANNTKPCYCCVEVVKGHVITSTVCPPGMESKKIWRLSNREESVTGLNGPTSHNSMAPQFASQYRAPLSNISNGTFPNACQSVSRPRSTSSYGCHSDSPVLSSANPTESSSQSHRDTGIRTQGACNQSQQKTQSVNTMDFRVSGTQSENPRQSAIHDQSKQPNYFMGSQDYSSQTHIPRQSPSLQPFPVAIRSAGCSNGQTSQVISGSQSSINSGRLHSIDNRPTVGSPPQLPFGSMAFQAPHKLNSGNHTSYKIDPNPVIDTTQMDYTTLSSSLTIKVPKNFKPISLKYANSVCHGDLPIGRVREEFCAVGTPFLVSDPYHYCVKCGRRIHQHCGVRVQYSDISQPNNHVMCLYCYESEVEYQRISVGFNSRRKAETHLQSSILKKSKHNHLEHFLLAPRPWTKDTLEKAYIQDSSLKRNNAFTIQVSEAHLLMAEFGAKLRIGPILNLRMFEDNLKMYSAELEDMAKLMAAIKWGLANLKNVNHLNVFDRSDALTKGHTAYLYAMVRFNLSNLDMADFSVGLWKACVQILALYLGKCNGKTLEKMERWMKELAAMQRSQCLHIESVRWHEIDNVIELLKKLFRIPKQNMQAMENMIWRLFRCALEAVSFS